MFVDRRLSTFTPTWGYKGERMATINTEDLLTIKQVSEELGMPSSAVTKMLKAVDPALKAGNTQLWLREDVRSYLYGMNEDLLTFLGVRPPSESYDSVITSSDEV